MIPDRRYNCAWCDKPGIQYRKTQRFCSKLCQSRKRFENRPSRALPSKTKKCMGCLKAFDTTRPKQRFCTVRCAHKWHVERNREKINTRAKLAMRKKRKEAPEVVRNANARYREKPENRRRAATATRIWHYENKAYSNPRRQMRKQKERNNYPWKGPLDAARRRAIERDLPFDIDDAWAQARWTGRCELSDLPFVIGARGNGPRYFAASIDRIKPELGYTKENSRFILWAINAFKYTGTDEDLFMVAEALMKRRSPNAAQVQAAPE